MSEWKMSIEELLRYLKALADETRLRLLTLHLTQDLCVGALAHRMEISEAAVSQHLQVLRKAGLIKREKCGYWTHYSVVRDVLRQLTDELKTIADQPSCTEVICCRKEVKKDV
jgi:ArsR family transcriptional regulator, arsenate/arsenite/antimonite-responsive transcriptional repressor